MRGTLPDYAQVDCTVGIIPAYAGNTFPTRLVLSYPWDHPRVCGEHIKSGNAVLLRGGSSPRMRGTPAVDRQTHVFTGIIPAYAGNTSSGRASGR